MPYNREHRVDHHVQKKTISEMTVKDLQILYDYAYWVNEKLFAVLAAMDTAEFTSPVTGSPKSIRDTMVHVLSAEWGWLDRCGGHKRPGRLKPTDFSTVEQMVALWRSVETHVRAFLVTLTDADLIREVAYPGAGGVERKMPLGELMHHAANHAVHHRGQVAMMIRMAGYTPGNFDLLFYYAEQRGTPAW